MLKNHGILRAACVVLLVWAAGGPAPAEEPTFDELVKQLRADKPKFAQRHQELLKQR
jgi:hypothetical protein